MQPSVPTGRAVDSAGTPASDLWTCNQERQPGRGRDDGACARQDLTRKSQFAVRWRVWTGRSESRNRSTPPARCHVGRHLARPRYVAHSRASSATGRDPHGDSSGVFPGRSPSESPAATTTTERHPMPATTSTTRGPPGRFTARGVSATSPRSRRKRRSARTPRLPPATKRSAVIAAARRTPRAAPRTRPRSSLGHTMASAGAPTDALRRSGMPPAGVEPARPV